VLDNEDDSNGNYRSLNSDHKGGSRSNRKIKPIQYVQGGKQILKVVQEDDQVSGGSGAYLPKSNFMSIVTSPQYQQI
jgi:hypothetical protein